MRFSIFAHPALSRFIITGVATIWSCSLLAIPQAPQANTHNPLELNIADILEVRDWLAVGSGCKARMNKKGNIDFKLERDQLDPSIYRAVFDIAKYQLDGTSPINKDRPTFARECSFRVAVYPAKRWKIAGLTMNGDVYVAKGKGATAEIYSRLLTGTRPLNEKAFVFGDSEAISGKKLALSMSPSPEGDQHLKQTPCEGAKLLGADLSFINRRKTFVPQVRISANEKAKIVLTIKLEPCRVHTDSV